MPVPAGPTPKVMVFLAMDSQYRFWPTVFGFTGRPLAVTHTESVVMEESTSSLPSPTSEIT